MLKSTICNPLPPPDRIVSGPLSPTTHRRREICSSGCSKLGCISDVRLTRNNGELFSTVLTSRMFRGELDFTIRYRPHGVTCSVQPVSAVIGSAEPLVKTCPPLLATRTPVSDPVGEEFPTCNENEFVAGLGKG